MRPLTRCEAYTQTHTYSSRDANVYDTQISRGAIVLPDAGLPSPHLAVTGGLASLVSEGNEVCPGEDDMKESVRGASPAAQTNQRRSGGEAKRV